MNNSNHSRGLITILFLIFNQAIFSASCSTKRQFFIENSSVKIWKTLLCPHQKLEFHAHQFPRVIIPEEDGYLKVIYKSGKEKGISLKRKIPFFLSATQGKELHQDENLGLKPLHLTVIELKNG